MNVLFVFLRNIRENTNWMQIWPSSSTYFIIYTIAILHSIDILFGAMTSHAKYGYKKFV